MTHISFYGNDELVSAYICMGEQISQQIYVFNHPVNNTKILYYYSTKNNLSFSKQPNNHLVYLKDIAFTKTQET